MKEAAGEANMTVITIVLIGIVLAIGGIVVKTLMKNTSKSSVCASLGGKYSSSVTGSNEGGCVDDSGNELCFMDYCNEPKGAFWCYSSAQGKMLYHDCTG